MPFLVSGSPLHVLVVHAVVVLVPLAVLATVVVALWPAARRRFGWPVVALTAVATAAIPVATSSGEDLRDRLPDTELVRQHAELGDQLLVFVAALLVVSAALVWLQRRPLPARFAAAGVGSRLDAPGAVRSADRAGAPRAANGSPVARLLAGPGAVPGWVGIALAALTVVLAVVSGVQVVRIGDSGARAAWQQTQYTAPREHGDR